MVARLGFEPRPNRLTCHYSFRYNDLHRFCGLDYAFTVSLWACRWVPSSLYARPNDFHHSAWLGVGSSFDRPFTEFGTIPYEVSYRKALNLVQVCCSTGLSYRTIWLSMTYMLCPFNYNSTLPPEREKSRRLRRFSGEKQRDNQNIPQ